MAIFYFLALIPMLIGVWIWLWKRDRIPYWECLIATASAFALAGILHWVSFASQVTDYETFSGRIISGQYDPPFVEQYTEYHSETTTDSQGRSTTRTWTTTEYDHHGPHWSIDTSIESSHSVEPDFFERICDLFKSREAVHKGSSKCTHGGILISGDPNIYVTHNRSGYLYPVNEWRRFENRIKASHTLFDVAKIPDSVHPFAYPKNENWYQSERLVGRSKQDFDLWQLDCLNARVGASKKINVILVGFDSPDMMMAQWQRAAWLGGRKNDLVICYGMVNGAVAWAQCFGWTEQEIVKQDLATLLLQEGASDAVLPKIEKLIQGEYRIVNWHKFDYIAIEPTPRAVVVYAVLMLITQLGLWWYFLTQGFSYPIRRAFA